jgi:glycosyl hydrolase family 113
MLAGFDCDRLYRFCSSLANAQKIRGMNFAHSLREEKGYGTAASLDSLRELRRLGVDSIAITPFGFQRFRTDTKIVWVGNGGSWIGETDDRLRAVTRQAHGLALTVMLKPHLWLRPPEWPGSIDHRTEPRWKAWFASYREFILHYARLAEEVRAESFSVGNELVLTTPRERDRRKIIGAVRRVYHGRVTYGANLDEFADVPFWDARDFIGISAYFPLTKERSPSVETMIRAWQPIAEELARLSARTRRPIGFTELGYRSSDYAAAKPWEHGGSSLNLKLQADAFEAFFLSIWPRRWFGGVYIWKCRVVSRSYDRRRSRVLD